ncbi:hypothetical protein HZB93_03775 [Candidatus Falkowbacteria bacterium]|nr:hypothetical protein [Candidatus Falkowbacteria bacterium]
MAKEEPMTLGELAARGDLVGRVFRAHEKSGFAYRGIVAKTEVRGDSVVLFLSNHARRFEGKLSQGSWKHLPDTEVPYSKNLSIQKTVGETFTFSLADGGRGYFHPRGTKLEEVEHAPLV